MTFYKTLSLLNITQDNSILELIITCIIPWIIVGLCIASVLFLFITRILDTIKGKLIKRMLYEPRIINLLNKSKFEDFCEFRLGQYWLKIDSPHTKLLSEYLQLSLDQVPFKLNWYAKALVLYYAEVNELKNIENENNTFKDFKNKIES